MEQLTIPILQTLCKQVLYITMAGFLVSACAASPSSTAPTSSNIQVSSTIPVLIPSAAASPLEETLTPIQLKAQLNKANDAVQMTYLKKFLPDKYFYNSCASREEGKFETDGTLIMSGSWEDVLAGERPDISKGTWKFIDDSLIMQTPLAADGYGFDNLFFGLDEDGQLIAAQTEKACGLLIGPDLENLKNFRHPSGP